jgi:predicted acetyltransferase
MNWTVRTLGDDDWADFLRVDSHAFGSTMPADLVEAERELHEPGRSIGAYGDAGLSGIATAFSYEIGVPGGVVPAAAVSWVGVLPTARRRGVLSALMDHQIAQVHGSGREPIAILWASEPQIYGRFGYGLASRAVSYSVPRDPAALDPSAPSDPAVTLRLADPAGWKEYRSVYEDVAARRPGVPARDDRWWRRATRDLPDLREGSSELRCVLAEDSAGPRGYALYVTKHNFGADFGSGEVVVREVMAGDAATLAALYRYLFDLDLMASTSLWNVPVDDPLPHWLQNPRRSKPRLADALYVRLVDLASALRARRYAAAIDVVIEVRDTRCPWNAGRWRVTGDPGAATCERTDTPAHIELDVADLGAAYLGGTTFAELALAGRVVERTDGALAAASAAFGHSPAPWCPQVF